MDLNHITPHCILGVLLSGTAVLSAGCGVVVLPGEGDPDEAQRMVRPESLHRALPPGGISSDALYDVLTPQVLEALPGVEVTEEIDEDGEVSYLLNNGTSSGSVQCKCSGGSGGVCYGSFPRDGSPATCVGSCDDAGAICTWISRSNPTGLAITEGFDELTLGF